MVNIFDEGSENGGIQFKGDPEDFDENEAAKLASMHEGEILDEDGSVYNENEGFEEDAENDDIII